jgi:septum formation protein
VLAVDGKARLPMTRLILASASPQRREILTRVGFSFDAIPATGMEELTEGPPEAVVAENARRKARAVAAAHPGATIVGCDTEVELDGRTLGKPPGEEAARALLGALSGREHLVHSGLVVIHDGREHEAIVTTKVRFRPLDQRFIDWYLATGEWRERAGGYAIQGRGAALVAGIEGDYLSVVGLPLATLLDLLPEAIRDSAFSPR